jgi:hypothetical protein
VDEFGIVIEALRSDDAAQHTVGGNLLDLALDLEQLGVVDLAGGIGLVADRAQIARSDQELRRGGVFLRREQDEQSRQNERGGGSGKDGHLAAPKGRPNFRKIDLRDRREAGGGAVCRNGC